MISLIYKIPVNEVLNETKWLETLKVCPSFSYPLMNRLDGIVYRQVGVIVTDDIAVLIKLRRQVNSQSEYRQR